MCDQLVPQPRKGRTPDVVYFWQVDFKTIKSVRFDSKHIEPIVTSNLHRGRAAARLRRVQVLFLLFRFVSSY